jgi:hypothetical protein
MNTRKNKYTDWAWTTKTNQAWSPNFQNDQARNNEAHQATVPVMGPYCLLKKNYYE